MSILELKTEEALYKIHHTTENHFSIECKCGGKDGGYTRSEYKNTRDVIEFEAIKPRPTTRISPTKFKFSFYMNEVLIRDELERNHRSDNNQPPLVIQCGDCYNRFSLTYDSYMDLLKRIRSNGKEKN